MCHEASTFALDFGLVYVIISRHQLCVGGVEQSQVINLDW